MLQKRFSFGYARMVGESGGEVRQQGSRDSRHPAAARSELGNAEGVRRRFGPEVWVLIKTLSHGIQRLAGAL